MPLYESKEYSQDKLMEMRPHYTCKECGGWLNVFLDNDKESPNKGKAFLACFEWHRSHHEGIAKEYTHRELNIPTRRKEMENQHGATKTKALVQYAGVTSLTKPQAMEILKTVYPDAPDDEVITAALLCASYGLNPLMNHVFLIPFLEKKTGKKKWARVVGIKANRLIASRKGSFSYVDDTPRLMTEEEQERRFGESYPDQIAAIVKLRDPRNGAEAVGYGMWPRGDAPYGMDKGNTKFNMAAIRAERQALDRLRPGEMPGNVEVADEQYLNGDYKVNVVEETVEPEPEPQESKLQATEVEPEPIAEEAKPKGKVKINFEDFVQSVNDLRWDVMRYIRDTYKITNGGNLKDTINSLTDAQRLDLLAALKERQEMK